VPAELGGGELVGDGQRFDVLQTGFVAGAAGLGRRDRGLAADRGDAVGQRCGVQQRVVRQQQALRAQFARERQLAGKLMACQAAAVDPVETLTAE